MGTHYAASFCGAFEVFPRLPRGVRHKRYAYQDWQAKNIAPPISLVVGLDPTWKRHHRAVRFRTQRRQARRASKVVCHSICSQADRKAQPTGSVYSLLPKRAFTLGAFLSSGLKTGMV